MLSNPKTCPAKQGSRLLMPIAQVSKATLLFQLFKLVELTQKMGAADDVEHTECLNQMRYPQAEKPSYAKCGNNKNFVNCGKCHRASAEASSNLTIF